MTVELGQLRSPEATGPGIVLLPIGSLEQHGPHLPLDTDTRIAVALSNRAASNRAASRRAALSKGRGGERPVWVAPPLAYGSSGEHAGFPGTLSMGQAALEAVVVELARSAGPEVAALVVVNGHGGNIEALRRAEARCRAEGRAVGVWSPRVPDGDAHAGRTETSLLLAIAPNLVAWSRAEAGSTRPLAELLPTLRSGGVAAVSANGVLGDPAGASATEGEALLTALVEDLVAFLEAFAGE